MKVNSFKHNQKSFKALYFNIEPEQECIHLIGHTKRHPEDGYLKLATCNAQVDGRFILNPAIKIGCPKNLDLLMDMFYQPNLELEEPVVRNFLTKTFQEVEIVKTFRRICDQLHQQSPYLYDSSLEIFKKMQDVIKNGHYNSYFSYGHSNSTKIISFLQR